MNKELTKSMVRLVVIGALVCCAVGCATTSEPRGSVGEAALGGSLAGLTVHSSDIPAQPDYRDVISSPGNF